MINDLIQAIQDRDITSVTSLLDMGVSPNCRDEDGQTPLAVAIRNEDRDMCKLLLKHGAEVTMEFSVEVRQANNWHFEQMHALRFAMDTSRPLADIILYAWSEVNYQDSNGNTALHTAASYNCLDAVNELLGRGADPNISNNTGESALHVALLHLEPEMVSSDGVLYVYSMSCPEVLMALIEGGSDVNAQMGDGLSPLQTICAGGYLNDLPERELLPVVQLMIEKGADIDAKDLYGYTALARAASGEKWLMVHGLIAAGADSSALHFLDKSKVIMILDYLVHNSNLI